VAIGVEIHIAEAVGMMNIALPSIVIKMMRQKFEQQWSVRKTQASESEQSRLLGMLREVPLTLEARLEGLGLSVEHLLSLSEGHLVIFGQPVGSTVALLVNGREQYYGQIVNSSGKRSFALEQVREKEPMELPAASPHPSLPEPEKALAVSR
jgi:flagellar motor switch protein FliM